MDSDKKRGGNFMKRERDILVDEVVSASTLLFSKFSSTVDNQSKSAKWVEITQKINASGGEEVRTVKQVKKKWQDLKKTTKGKEAARLKYCRGTGGGPAPPAVSPVYEKILSILPKCSVDGITEGMDTLQDANITKDTIVHRYKFRQSILQDKTEEEHTCSTGVVEIVPGSPESPDTPEPAVPEASSTQASRCETSLSEERTKGKSLKRKAQASFEEEFLEIERQKLDVHRGILQQLTKLVETQQKLLEFQTTTILCEDLDVQPVIEM